MLPLAAELLLARVGGLSRSKAWGEGKGQRHAKQICVRPAGRVLSRNFRYGAHANSIRPRFSLPLSTRLHALIRGIETAFIKDCPDVRDTAKRRRTGGQPFPTATEIDGWCHRVDGGFASAAKPRSRCSLERPGHTAKQTQLELLRSGPVARQPWQSPDAIPLGTADGTQAPWHPKEVARAGRHETSVSVGS